MKKPGPIDYMGRLGPSMPQPRPSPIINGPAWVCLSPDHEHPCRSFYVVGPQTVVRFNP